MNSACLYSPGNIKSYRYTWFLIILDGNIKYFPYVMVLIKYELSWVIRKRIILMSRLNSEDFSKSRNRGNIIFWLGSIDETRRDLQNQPDFFSNILEYSWIKSYLKWKMDLKKNGNQRPRYTCYIYLETSWATACFEPCG